MQLFGPPNVEKLKTKADVRGLIKALSYKKEASVRAGAAKAVGELKGPGFVEPLVNALKDSDIIVRREAAKALGKLNDSSAVEPLTAVLKDSATGVRQAAAEALDSIGWLPGNDENSATYWIAKREWTKCIEMGAVAVEPLIAELKDGNKDIRQATAKALGELKDPRAVEPLIVTLKDNDASVRWEVAKALGEFKDSRAVEPIIAALKDKITFQSEAAGVLAQIGAPAVVPLITVLKNTPNSFRWHTPEAAAYYGAIEALEKIGPSAVEPLIAVLKDGNEGIRQASAKALGVLEDPRSVEPLIAALKDSDEYVRKAAANALVCIGTPAIEPLIGVLKDGNKEVPREVFKALGRIKDPRVIELLISMLKDSDKDVRWQVAEALESLGWQPGRDENGAAYWVAKKEKRYPSSIEEIMRQFGFSYYFLLTFSSEDEAKIFWERITSRQNPPVPTVLLWGSWISLDFGNVQRYFVAWLTDGQSYSNAIDRWWHAFRPEDTPTGAGYGSPNSPLGVRMEINKVYGEKKLRCT